MAATPDAERTKRKLTKMTDLSNEKIENFMNLI